MSSSTTLSPSMVMARDAHAYKKVIERGKLSPSQADRFAKSAAEVQERTSRIPEITYDTDLPIRDSLPEIERLLQNHKVIIVAGETGSGKTTQIPLACLKAGFGVRGMICQTQPRRLAASSVANRIASELNVGLGEEVGYAVRFDDKVSARSLVKIVTDGLLLTEIQRDRFLTSYDTIIVDEAHERSMNIDFLMGYLKILMRRRDDLRTIVTSATIDVEAFSKYFDNAPVVTVEGRTYPVEVRYRPPVENLEDSVRECVSEITASRKKGPRDVLMFLAGERDILEWAHWLRREYRDQFEILPLYARLPSKEQQKIFQRGRKQRILLSTNVAETSLTVPNIRYVIDLGEARISRYSFGSRIQRLPIETISQASASQRAGRCGRIAPGVCFRVYDESDYENRNEYTDPEIKRTNLASVVLQMLMFRFGDVQAFPFLDPPEARAVNAAKRLLHELGALKNDSLTAIGRQMAVLPVDPRLARMLIEANTQRALKEILIIVSALAVQDPRLRPLDKREAADRAQEVFSDERSDFMTFVRMWDWAEEWRTSQSRREFDRRLERVFISPKRYREWRALHRQLRLACLRLRMKVNRSDADYESVHRSILSGSLSFVGFREEKNAYIGARELKFFLFPGSVLAKRKPKWIVSSEIIETTRTYARCLATIEPSWIENYAHHLLNRRTSNPYWDERRHEAMVLLDLSLYGLPIVRNRRVRLALENSDLARKLFAKHALVRDEGHVRSQIIQANRSLVRQLEQVQAQGRRLDVVANEDQLTDFYLENLPTQVEDTRSFLKWYRKASEGERRKILMQTEDILMREDVHLRPDAFPSELQIADNRFPLKYKFAPGEKDDGVSIQVKLSQLRILNQPLLDWLVQGFFESKCSELLKALPKSTRKKLSPISDRVSELVPTLLKPDQFREGDFFEILSERIFGLFGVQIPSDEWNREKIPQNLNMNVQVVDLNGRILDQDRDFVTLRDRVLQKVNEDTGDAFRSKYERIGLQAFPENGLPRTRVIDSPSGKITVYPLIEDLGDSVNLKIQLDSRGQYEKTLRGMCRLVLLNERTSVKFLTSEFRKDQSLQLHYAPVGSVEKLLDEVLLSTAAHVYFSEGDLPRTEVQFEGRLSNQRGELVRHGLSLMDSARAILEQRHKVALQIDSMKSKTLTVAKHDLQKQLSELIREDFPYSVPFERLADIPRYLSAMKHRIDNLQGRVLRDREATQEIQNWEERLGSLRSEYEFSQALVDISFLLQEYRIALFSQSIKTRVRVSPKRLEKVFAAIE